MLFSSAVQSCIALLRKAMLSMYYIKLLDSITSVKTIKNPIDDIDFLDLNKLKFMIDKRFYSKSNINDLFIKITISFSLKPNRH